MKILSVTQVPLDETSGATLHVLGITEALAKAGHRITLIAQGDDHLRAPGIRRIRAPFALRPGIRLEATFAALAVREALRERPDIAYLRVSPSTSLVPLSLARLSIPIVLELNGRIIESLRAAGRPEPIVRVARTALRLMTARAKATIAPSVGILEEFENELGSKNTFLIPNGTDLEVATPGDRDEAKRMLGLDPARRYVSLIAIMLPEQRVDLLLEAAPRLPEDVTLLIAGSGPRMGSVETASREAKRNLINLGFLPQERAIVAMRASEICLGLHEKHVGTKALISAALGRRMVTFDVEGVDRIRKLYPALDVIHIAKEKSAEAIASAIMRALETERSQGPIPAREIETAREGLSWNETARELTEVFASCVSSS